MKLGMIGLDTSHVSELSKVFNDPAHPFHIQDMPVVKAFPGGSKNTSFSYNRVEKYTAELAGRNIEMVNSIRELDGLDGYLLESVDGLQHFEQFEQLVAFGKPVFIDKPLACSYTAAKAIYELSKNSGVPFFTASSIRYSPGVADLCPADEKVCGAEAFGPMLLSRLPRLLLVRHPHRRHHLLLPRNRVPECPSHLHADHRDPHRHLEGRTHRHLRRKPRGRILLRSASPHRQDPTRRYPQHHGVLHAEALPSDGAILPYRRLPYPSRGKRGGHRLPGSRQPVSCPKREAIQPQ